MYCTVQYRIVPYLSFYIHPECPYIFPVQTTQGREVNGRTKISNPHVAGTKTALPCPFGELCVAGHIILKCRVTQKKKKKTQRRVKDVLYLSCIVK